MNTAFPHPRRPAVLALCLCLLVMTAGQSLAHRVQDYERWPLDKLCAEAEQAGLDRRDQYIREIGKRFGHEPKAVEMLAAIIANPKEDMLLRDTACRIINLTTAEGGKHIQMLMGLARSKDAGGLQLEALRTLAQQCPENRQVIELHLQIANDRSRGSILRRNAVYFMGQYLGDAPGMWERLKGVARQRDEDPHVRYNAAAQLSRNHRKVDGALALLISMVLDKTEDPFVRCKVLWCFGAFASDVRELSEVVHEVAIDAGNPQELRDLAVEMLLVCYGDTPRGMPLALEMIADSRRTTFPRVNVISHIKNQRRGRTHVPVFIQIANTRDDHECVRTAVIDGLHCHDEEGEVFQALSEIALDQSDDGAVRIAALKQLAKRLPGVGGALPVLKTIARRAGDDVAVRMQSLFILSYQAKDDPGVPRLLKDLVLDVEEKEIRGKAAFYLSVRYPQTIGAPELVAWALQDPQDAVRREALRALSTQLKIEAGVENRLLLEDTVSSNAYIDPVLPITAERVSFVAGKLNWPEETVKSGYEDLAAVLPLQLDWKIR